MTDATRDTRAIGNVYATKQQIRLASQLSMTMARIAAIDYDDKQPMNVKSMASCVPRMWHTYQTWPGTVHLIQYQTDLLLSTKELWPIHVLVLIRMFPNLNFHSLSDSENVVMEMNILLPVCIRWLMPDFDFGIWFEQLRRYHSR